MATEQIKAEQHDEEEEEEETGETLEAIGQLESDIGAMFDQVLASIDPLVKLDIDSDAHKPLRPELMFMREEMRMAKRLTLAVRRMAIRKLLVEDFRKQQKGLKKIRLAYSVRDP